MTIKKWAMIIIITGLVAATIIIVAYLLLGPEDYLSSSTGAKKNYSLPAAKGDINDSISALLKEADYEQLIAAEDDNYIDTIYTDNKEIGGFGQTFNENEF
jgi:hypothetical protein